MAPRILADDLPHDNNGYREYGIMLHATEQQIQTLRKFHEAIGLSDFVTRAHTSVHNVAEPELGEVMARLSSIAVETQPIRIELDPEGAKPWGDGRAGGFGVVENAPLLQFHEAVVQALDPITKSLRQTGRKFWPHITAYLAADAEESERAKKLLPKLDLGPDYVARSVELIGRRGPARGGSYTVLASFPFGVRVGPKDPPL